jgi:hypothetical protein
MSEEKESKIDYRDTQKIVDDEIRNILKIELDLDKRVIIFGKEMSVKEAIYMYYQDIELLNKAHPKYPSVMDLMYRSLMKTTKHGKTCIGRIGISNDENSLRYSNGTIFFSKGESKEQIKHFFKDVIQRLNKCNYIIYVYDEYITYDDGFFEAHASSLIIVNFEKYILVYHYDSAGTESDGDEIHPFGTAMLKFIVDGIGKATGKETRLVEGESVCPIGLQELSVEEDKYCVLWSSFWIYMLLQVLIKTEKRASRKLFNISDSSRMEETFSKLEVIIFNSKYINKALLPESLEKLILKYAILVLSEYDTHPNRPDVMKFLNRELLYNNKRLLRNNKPCESYKQCISQNCVKGYCRRPDTSRPKKLFTVITGRPPKSQEEIEEHEDSGSEELKLESHVIDSDTNYSSEQDDQKPGDFMHQMLRQIRETKGDDSSEGFDSDFEVKTDT